VLCSKLRRFSYDEIEFFLPQLCHLTISVNNDSMALEEFILDLCEESVNAALLVGSLHDHAGRTYIANEMTDILALSDIPTRSFTESASGGLPDVPEDIQQGSAHRFRPCRTRAK
jgi:hypothetical protein